MKNRITMGMIGITMALVSAAATYACPITIENDTNDPIDVRTNDETKEMLTISPGHSDTFGSHNQHAEFTVMQSIQAVQPQIVGSDLMIQMQNLPMEEKTKTSISIKQHSCSKDPVLLKASKILAEDVDKQLFKISTAESDGTK